MADIEKFVAGLEFNGDGVISAAQIADKELRATVEDIIKCRGSGCGLSGKPGINQEISDAFFPKSRPYLGLASQATAMGTSVSRVKRPARPQMPFMP